jgi:hypothetical protein
MNLGRIGLTVKRRSARGGRIAAAIAASALGVGALAAPALAATPPDGSANYTMTTLNNAKDNTFNQLLGINNSGLIAGYFGSGAAGHPNKGYTLASPYGQANYANENFPGSVQTQVTGLNNKGVTVGFWVDAAGNNNGFYAINGKGFTTANAPQSGNATPRVDQLLGVNDSGLAVGFFNGPGGSSHAYTYNINTKVYKGYSIAGASSVTATAVNNLNDIAGFETQQSGKVVSFLQEANGKLITLSVPGATATTALGVNDGDEVVGAYTVGTQTFGFAWTPGFGFQTVNDPHGVGSTTINGLNDRGQLVGFYTDAAGNTDGLLATP